MIVRAVMLPEGEDKKAHSWSFSFPQDTIELIERELFEGFWGRSFIVLFDVGLEATFESRYRADIAWEQIQREIDKLC